MPDFKKIPIPLLTEERGLVMKSSLKFSKSKSSDGMGLGNKKVLPEGQE
jgi:hypothetical protein